MSEELLWRLKLEPDATAKQTLGEFESLNKSTDEEIVKSNRKRSDETATLSEKTAREQVKDHRFVRDQASSINREMSTSYKQSLNEQSAAHQKLMSEIEEGRREMGETQRELNDGLVQGTQGLIQFGTGFAEIGLASEETVEGMIRGLVRLQGALDVVEGAMNIFRGLTTALKLYETLQTRSAAVTQATTKANMIAVHKEALAWEHLAGARIAAQGAGAGGAVVGGVAGGVGKSVAGGAAAGGVAGAFGAKIVAGGKIAAGAVFSTAGAAVAAGTGAALAPSLYGLHRDRRGLKESESRLASQTRAGDAAFEAQQRAELNAEQDSKLLFRGSNIRESRLESSIGRAESPEAQKKLLADAFRGALSDRVAASGLAGSAKTSATRQAAESEAERLTERLKDLAERRLAVEREILASAKETSKERERAASEELKLVRDRMAAEKDRLKSGARRFGQMDREQQDEARAAIKQARQFGGASLSREQSSLLSTIGTQDASRFAEQADLARAERAGFSRNFGRGERSNFADQASKGRALTIQVQTEQKIQAELTADEDQIARQTARQVVKLQQEQETRINRKIKEEIDRAKLEIARLTRDQIVAQRNLTP